MSDKNKKNRMVISTETENGQSLVPEEDEAFESAAAEKYREELLNEEERAEAAVRREQQRRRDYERRLRDEKVAMLREKQGVEKENSEEDRDDEPEKPEPMTFGKKLENFWYHYKWTVIIAVVAIGFGVYMIAELLSNTQPDMIVLCTVDNGLMYRADEVEGFFKKYGEDLNGDGEVYIQVIFTPMDASSGGDQLTQSYETKLYSNLSNADAVLFITDEASIFSIEQVAFQDMSGKLDSEYVSGDSLSLNGKLVRDSFNWAQMPEDMVIKMREPVKTLFDEADEMEKSCDAAYEILEKMLADMESYQG